MTTPLPPGWYPDPNGKPDKLYWDGREWFSAPPPPEESPSPTPPPPPPEEPPPPTPPPPEEPPPPVPGWFLDPSDPSRQRYFDGNEWTENYALIGATPPKPDTSTGKKTEFQLNPTAVLITLGILGLVIWFAVAQGGSDDRDRKSSSSPSSTTTTTTATSQSTLGAPPPLQDPDAPREPSDTKSRALCNWMSNGMTQAQVVEKLQSDWGNSYLGAVASLMAAEELCPETAKAAFR